MPAWKQYFLAHTILEALEALSASPSPARLVAGGTDLLLELQQGHQPPVETLVDVSCIADLGCLEVRDGSLFIGAAVPVSQVTESPLVLKHALAVSEACGLIGGPQVRNTATLGGNVAHALPAADGMISLLALDAQAEIAFKEGDSVMLRQVPLLSLFRGPGKTTLDTTKEILTGFYIALARDGQASAFGRVMRPQGVALPILNVAVWLERCETIISNIRVSVGPAGPVPQRAVVIEEILKGAQFGGLQQGEILSRVGEVWRTGMHFRTSPQRATAGYRHHLSSALFERALFTAWDRAASLTVEVS
ncbi:MAG: FAD binding domain-containing protein [Anaerolineaceae bacterium]|nr:FAD binding domain-containing protein [Anaerolineaceae bacterium]